MTNFFAPDRFLQEAQLYPDLFLGRVTAQHANFYHVTTQHSDANAQISGKFLYSVKNSTDYPAVGDFVMIDREDASKGNAVIHHILSRKSQFVRRAAGTSHEAQVVATNIDSVFICMSLDHDFNPRRLERYIAIAWDSGATPVLVLTKSDMCAQLTDKLNEIKTIALGIDVLVTSSVSKAGVQDILPYVSREQTVAFMGSSGVGKSTLINRLIGDENIATREVGKRDKGRHTTTHRELYILPTGGAVIDTPGMRELGLESVDLAMTFSDLAELASRCKFSNCQHKNEPGCAIQKSIADGMLSEERLHSYNKLKKEAKYEGLNSKQIEKAKIDEMYTDFGGIKNAKAYAKLKHKTREDSV